MFDPSKPANNSPLSSAEMRGQLNGLNQAVNDALSTALAASSNNSNAVSTLAQGADSSYNQSQMQTVLDKIDELINALRR